MRRPVGIRCLGAPVVSAVLAALVASGCGGGGEASERADPFEAVEQSERAVSERARGEAAPRWDRVATLRGSGDAQKGVRIKSDAVQWRVRWRCDKGSFRINATPAPEEGNPLGSGRCPDDGEAVAIDTGELQLAVQTKGRWEAVVEQQVTDPIDEPPLAKMKAEGAEVVASGRFYAIERRGRGKAVLHKLPSGRLALRLEGFATTANTDLFVWVSRAGRPRTSRQALRSDHLEFAPLKATMGNQNYLLPKNTDAKSIRSVVIWCEPIRIAYTAASLTR